MSFKSLMDVEVQGYLAHPHRPRPTVRSEGGAFSYKRGTPVGQDGYLGARAGGLGLDTTRGPDLDVHGSDACSGVSGSLHWIFVDFDLIDRMVGVSPYRPQARIRPAMLNRRATSHTSELLIRIALL